MTLSPGVYGIALFALLGLSMGYPQSESSQPSPSATEAVTLIVTVTDRQQHAVAGLTSSNFKVYENGELQPVLNVTQIDVPMCMGLLVDNSGSMRHKRGEVISALHEFVRARGRADSFFVVNFNDLSYMDQDLTNDVTKIESALDRADARGGTALYDSLIASADHLIKARACGKRVMLVVTDGKDNESRTNLQKTLEFFLEPKAPVLYAIALPENGPWNQEAQRALESLTNNTGGRTYFVDNMKNMKKAGSRLLEELSRQYTLVYARTETSSPGPVRKVQVMVKSPEQDLLVRARAGFRINGQPDK